MSRASASLWTSPSHQKVEVTPGTILTHAAKRPSTRALAMAPPTSWEGTVIRTTMVSGPTGSSTGLAGGHLPHLEPDRLVFLPPPEGDFNLPAHLQVRRPPPGPPGLPSALAAACQDHA